MKKIPSWIIIIIILAILTSVKFIFFAKKNTGAPAAGKAKTLGPVSVNYFVAQTSSISNNVYTTGKIGALNEIEIKPEIAGKVVAIYF